MYISKKQAFSLAHKYTKKKRENTPKKVKFDYHFEFKNFLYGAWQNEWVNHSSLSLYKIPLNEYN